MAKFKYCTNPRTVEKQYQGWLYEGEGSCRDVFKIVNRKDAIKKNAKGQVYAADMFVQERYHTSTYSTAGRTNYSFAVGQGNYELIKKGDVDVCGAILAIPARYGNLPDTARDRAYQSTAWRAETWHENEVYYYIFVVKLAYNRDDMKYSFPNKKPQSPTQGFYAWRASCSFDQPHGTTTDDYLVIDKPVSNNRYFSNTTTDARADFQTTLNNTTGRLRNLEELYSELETANNSPLTSRRTNAYNQSYGFIDNGVMATLKTDISHWKERENSSFSNIWTMYAPAAYLPSYVTSQKLSSNIASGFPIFELHNFDQMVEYFEGGKWEADNYPIPDDWSTDWDVYVKGTQKPDIFITMKSDKVDEWLKSDKNLSGYKKEDIAVEYRYRYHKRGNYPDSEGHFWNKNEFTLKYLTKQKYDKTYETGWVSNCDLNYEGFVIEYGNEFAEGTISNYFTIYAEMEFRIKLDAEHYSAWCRYEIGVIGSPSVPDFSKMNNLGIQDDDTLIDSSTVTLHYDEYPDDFDPYPEPEPPTPKPPKPTDPKPSVTGIGLLTETYRLTDEQAKALGRFFWGGDTFQKILALNLSPIENVVGLHYMPIYLAGTADVIVIGDVDTNINAERIQTTTPLYTLGSVKIEGRYKNFLDYEPYTSAWIFLPFVGFIRINPVFFTGKTLKVVYTYDLICGLCMAMLYADDIYIESHQGKCGLEIPLVAGNRAQLETSLAMSLVTQGLTAAATGGLGTMNAAGIAGSIGSYIENFHSTREGGYTPACAWAETRECFIVIESSNASYTASYNHDFGRPCMATYTIGQLKGFTMIDPNTELSGFDGITEEEMSRLRQILTSGFYV